VKFINIFISQILNAIWNNFKLCARAQVPECHPYIRFKMKENYLYQKCFKQKFYGLKIFEKN